MEPTFTAWTKIALRLIFSISLFMGSASLMAQPVQGGNCADCETAGGDCFCCTTGCDCTPSPGSDCAVGQIFYCDQDNEGEAAVESQCAFDEGIPVQNIPLFFGLVLSGIFVFALKTRSF